MSLILNRSSSVTPVGAVSTLTGNTGGPVSPILGNIDIVGSGGITVTGNPGTSTLTISGGGSSTSTTYVDTTPYAVLSSDQNILVDSNSIGGPSSIVLPDSPATDGQIWTIKDFSGGAAAGQPITISTVSSLAIIDGLASFVIANNYESVSVVWSLSEATYSIVSEVLPAFIELPESTATTGYVSINGDVVLQAVNDTNIFLGANSGNFTTSAGVCTGVGYNSLNAVTTGDYNVAVGSYALRVLEDGQVNTALGYQSMAALVSGDSNCGVGENTLLALTDGSYNLAMGQFSGANYTTTESSNITFNHGGVTAESNTLRIGSATGTGNQELQAAYICGIDAVDLNTTTIVTQDSDQLGSADLTAGPGITIVPTAGIITISGSGGPVAYTNVNTSPYTVLSTDNYLSVDCSSIPITLRFPNTPVALQSFIVKDRLGKSNVNNITITTVGGSTNIDGANTAIMNTQHESLNLIGNGTTYEIF